MQKLIDIFYHFREYGVLILYTIISLWLYAVQSSGPVKTMRATALEIISTLESSISIVEDYISLKSQNRRLLEENIQLSSETNLLRNAARKYQDIKNMASFEQNDPSTLKLAKIVHRTFGTEQTLFTINLGSNDSISADMPVLNDQGLVGRVIMVSPNYALIQPIINTDFKVSVYCEKTGVMGVVHWKGNDESQANLEHVPISSNLEWGDRLYTTEFSTFSSPNILVGTITAFKKNEFFYDASVELAVDYSSLIYVFVDMRTSNREKEHMIRAYDSLRYLDFNNE